MDRNCDLTNTSALAFFAVIFFIISLITIIIIQIIIIMVVVVAAVVTTSCRVVSADSCLVCLRGSSSRHCLAEVYHLGITIIPPISFLF